MRRLIECSNSLQPASAMATSSCFEGADWMITPRDRVGLVGANGTGKSTLLKILAGSEGLDYGSVSRRQRHQRGLPATGWAGTLRTYCLRRVHVGVFQIARHGTRDGRTHRAHVGARPRVCGIRASRGALPASRARIYQPRRIRHRGTSRSRAFGAGFSKRRLDATD